MTAPSSAAPQSAQPVDAHGAQAAEPAGVAVAELAAFVQGRLHGDAARPIAGVASLERAQAHQVSFVTGSRHLAALAATAAGAVLVAPAQVAAVPAGCAAIEVADPYAAFARIAQRFAAAAAHRPPAGIHAHASVAADAVVAPSAHVGPRAVVESGARIGERCVIGPGCVVGRGAVVGDDTHLVANVTLYHDCAIGARCIVHAGAVIGADGFGFAPESGRWIKIPQTGRAIVGDDVEIGANTAIDRGALDDTIIGDGCKLDNLIQIGHNVQVGEHTAMAACAGVSGSTRIGAHCMVGGGAGFVGHIQVCDRAVIGGMTMVTRSITQPGFYTGAFPLMTNRDWERAAVNVRQLDALRRRVRALERGQRVAAPASRSDSADQP